MGISSIWLDFNYIRLKFRKKSPLDLNYLFLVRKMENGNQTSLVHVGIFPYTLANVLQCPEVAFQISRKFILGGHEWKEWIPLRAVNSLDWQRLNLAG